MALPADLADAPAPVGPPELSDDDYRREVLGHADLATDAAAEQELVAKAAALGIQVPAPRCPTPVDEPGGSSGDESARSPGPRHGRSASTASDSTATTELTSHFPSAIPATLSESTTPIPPRLTLTRRRSKSLTFSHYEKYLSHLDPALNQPKFAVAATATSRHERNKSTASADPEVGKRKDVVGDLKRRLTTRFRRRKPPVPSSHTIPCICCREDFPATHPSLHPLPCGHTYCRACLLVMVTQSRSDESKMPPRCCATPIPSALIKAVLPHPADQHLFLQAVLQYSTPWESRLFCPNPDCQAFIPPRSSGAPASEATCRACRTRVCVMCKRAAHRRGQDCPEDWELEAVLRMGERSGWRRCYKCRNLVELAQGCSHMTCRCKAQFCYICGAVWEPSVGCPNFCNGEEELERRRVEELERLAELEAEKEERERHDETARQEAEAATSRTRTNPEAQALRTAQALERERFLAFRTRAEDAMRARQAAKRDALVERYADLTERMRERHAKTEQHLEDRQIEAEMELRSTLEQAARSLRIQLRHMEAYCRPAAGGVDDMPEREVTQKHRNQLAQQYRLRDGMERRHQAQVNVLREKQAKRMEELVGRHAEQIRGLLDRREEEVEDLAVEAANDEEALVHVFAERREALVRRWALAVEVLRAELEAREGVLFGPVGLPVWDADGEGEEEEEAPETVPETEMHPSVAAPPPTTHPAPAPAPAPAPPTTTTPTAALPATTPSAPAPTTTTPPAIEAGN